MFKLLKFKTKQQKFKELSRELDLELDEQIDKLYNQWERRDFSYKVRNKYKDIKELNFD